MKNHTRQKNPQGTDGAPGAGRNALCDVRMEAGVVLFLVISILVIYWQVHGFQFISFDDPQIVSENPTVQGGISLENILWAFKLDKPGDLSYWVPLTVLSHMLDCELFGVNAGLHHLSNVFYHILNSVLLFIAIRLMCGSIWKSAFVASLFALHPVNVDSVAWIAERKNLLSTTFWMLTMIAYYFYTKKRTKALYLVAFAAFILGSLAKPMLVTLPFVLLLLDYWPLNRLGMPVAGDRDGWKNFYRTAWRLFLEKVPFIMAAFVFIYVNMALLSQKYTHLAGSSAQTPMDLRLKNAVVSYVVYMSKMFWPERLSIFHPYPVSVPWWQVAGSAAVLTTITVLVLSRLRKYPYLTVGWLWFLGTMVPVLGIVQAGLWPAIGERWAYVPFIGLFVMLAWGSGDLLRESAGRRTILAGAAAAVLAALSLQTWVQTGNWKDNFSIFSHSLRIDPDNYVAHVNLGASYANIKDYETAGHHFRQALKVHATDMLALEGLGRIYKNLGRYDEAIGYYSQIARYYPGEKKAYLELGEVMELKGDLDGAARQYRHILATDPAYAPAYYALGVISARKKDLDGAVGYFSEALRIDPRDLDAHCSIGVVLMNQGKTDEAVTHFREALRIDPNSEQAATYLASVDFARKVTEDIARLEKERLQNPNSAQAYQKLSMLYASKGDYPKALEMMNGLLRLKPRDPRVYYNIACIHAKKGDAGLAADALRKSVDMGFRDWELLKKDRDLDGIRATAFYKELMKDK